MQKFKKIIASFIIFAAVLTGVFIIGQNVAGDKSKVSLKDKKEIVKNFAANIPLNSNQINNNQTSSVKDLNKKEESAGNGEDTVKNEYQKPIKNSTEEIAGKIAQELIKKNPNGPSLLDDRKIIESIEPTKLVDEVILEELKNFDYSTFKPEVDRSKIETVSLADKQTVENYLKRFQEVLKKNFKSVNLNTDNLSTNNFTKLKQASENAIAELYNLKVPADLISLHTEEISLLAAQKNIFASLAKANSDPLKALLAIKALRPINDEFANLKQKFTDFISKNNLII